VTSGELVTTEVADNVGWIRLANPERRNALNASMAAAIRRSLVELAVDSTVRALVITGDDTAFCAGVDLSSTTRVHDSSFAESLELMLEELHAFPKPTIALVHGHCIGLGCAMATACDVRMAHPDASFAVPGARLGIRYPTSALRRLVTLIGPGRANLMLLAGRSTSAAVAATWGLVDVCDAEVDATATKFANAVTDIDPQVARSTRDAIRGASLYAAALHEAARG
jgi:enoyl-CoA hydratase/carnithine racemase